MRREDVVKTINNLKGEAGHKRVLDVYNSQCPLPRGYRLQAKDPWCAATVSAVLITNGYNDLSECSCTMIVNKAKELGIWIESDGFIPQIGDIILYDWQDNNVGDNYGTPDHIGIVIKVDTDEKKFVVREGNKSGTVGNRTMDVNGKYIRGFITPPYEADISGLAEQKIDNTPNAEKSEETAQTKREKYSVGKVYTINVLTALNVRKGAGKNYATVGYAGLTIDGKKHAYQPSGALKNGTRVTCLEVAEFHDSIWIRIPSGWICAEDSKRTYIK